MATSDDYRELLRRANDIANDARTTWYAANEVKRQIMQALVDKLREEGHDVE